MSARFTMHLYHTRLLADGHSTVSRFKLAPIHHGLRQVPVLRTVLRTLGLSPAANEQKGGRK